MFKFFKRRQAKKSPVRLTPVCETCYRDAELFDRCLMVMVADSQCEYCKEELNF